MIKDIRIFGPYYPPPACFDYYGNNLPCDINEMNKEDPSKDITKRIFGPFYAAPLCFNEYG